MTYTWSTVRKALGAGGTSGTLLAFREGGKRRVPSQHAMAAVAAAVRHANGLVPKLSLIGGEVLPSPQGALVPVYFRDGDRAVVAAWLDGLTDHLSAAGLTGKLGAATDSHVPRPGYDGYDHAPQAFVAYRMNEPVSAWRTTGGWSVDPDTTDKVTRTATAWGPRDRPCAVCQVGMLTGLYSLDPADCSGFLRSGAHFGDGITSLYYVNEDPPVGRYVALGVTGQLAAQSVNLQVPWKVMLDDLMEMLLIAPEATDLAFIKHTYCGVNLWESVQTRGLSQPVTRLGYFQDVREQWDQYAMDAHPLSLLTDAHLAKAHDLADWNVEQIAPGRHLVTAKNLEPWFTGGSPPDDILAKARADFGDMIYRKPEPDRT